MNNLFFDISPHYKNLETGRISDKVYEIVNPVRLNPREYIIKNVKKYYRTKNCNPIIFKNIHLLPHKEYQSETIFDLYNINGTETNDMNFFINGIIDALYKVITSSWNKDRFNIILHSSGFDSRILSFLIKRMAEEYGENFMGSFVFVCYGKEGHYFKKIMKYEGWNKEKYSCIRKDERRNSLRFKFSDCYKITNGSLCSPMSSLGLIYKNVEHLIEGSQKETTIWTARGFTEVLGKIIRSKNKNLMQSIDDKFYGSRYSQASVPFFVPSIFPIFGQPVLEFLCKNRIDSKNIKNSKTISKLICSHLGEEFVKLIRFSPKSKFKLESNIKKKINDEYKNSAYGKILKNKLFLESSKASGWVHWTCAGMLSSLKKLYP